MKNLSKILLVVFVVLVAYSCKEGNNYQELRDNELKLLDEYLTEHNIGEDKKTESGLYYIEVEAGTGDSLIKVGDRVRIFYNTYLIDSTLVDYSGPYTPLEFVVGAGSVISGLDEAATYMKLGTKANLIINSELAYGSSGSGYISGFETLLMDVEVYKVYPAEDTEE